MSLSDFLSRLSVFLYICNRLNETICTKTHYIARENRSVSAAGAGKLCCVRESAPACDDWKGV